MEILKENSLDRRLSSTYNLSEASVFRFLQEQRKQDLSLFCSVFLAVVSLTSLLVLAGVSIGFSIVLGVFIAFCVAAFVVRWPLVGFFIVAVCATLIEQNPLFTSIFTDRLYIYAWPPAL